jgi:hypothetical protein
MLPGWRARSACRRHVVQRRRGAKDPWRRKVRATPRRQKIRGASGQTAPSTQAPAGFTTPLITWNKVVCRRRCGR